MLPKLIIKWDRLTKQIPQYETKRDIKPTWAYLWPAMRPVHFSKSYKKNKKKLLRPAENEFKTGTSLAVCSKARALLSRWDSGNCCPIKDCIVTKRTWETPWALAQPLLHTSTFIFCGMALFRTFRKPGVAWNHCLTSLRVTLESLNVSTEYEISARGQRVTDRYFQSHLVAGMWEVNCLHVFFEYDTSNISFYIYCFLWKHKCWARLDVNLFPWYCFVFIFWILDRTIEFCFYIVQGIQTLTCRITFTSLFPSVPCCILCVYGLHRLLCVAFIIEPIAGKYIWSSQIKCWGPRGLRTPQCQTVHLQTTGNQRLQVESAALVVFSLKWLLVW